MKSVSRLMLGMAVVGVTFVALESQADAFFGRFGGRCGGGGHGHHHGCHTVSHCPPVCAPVACPPVCDPCCHTGHHHRRGFGLFRGRHRCHGGWGHHRACAPVCCNGVVHGDVYHGEVYPGEVIDGVPYEEPAPAAPEEPADAAPRA